MFVNEPSGARAHCTVFTLMVLFFFFLADYSKTLLSKQEQQEISTKQTELTEWKTSRDTWTVIQTLYTDERKE